MSRTQLPAKAMRSIIRNAPPIPACACARFSSRSSSRSRSCGPPPPTSISPTSGSRCSKTHGESTSFRPTVSSSPHSSSTGRTNNRPGTPGSCRQDANGVWSGPLLRSTGSYFGGPWIPGEQPRTQVGTVTFTPTSSFSGTLTYNVNNVNVTKQIQRQTLTTIPLGGQYYGRLPVDLQQLHQFRRQRSPHVFTNLTVTQIVGGTLRLDFASSSAGRSPRLPGNLHSGWSAVPDPNAAYTWPNHRDRPGFGDQGDAQGIEGRWTANVGAVTGLHRVRLLLRPLHLPPDREIPRRRRTELEQHHGRRGRRIQRFHATRHRNRDARVGGGDQRRRQPAAFVADRQGQRPAHVGRVEIGAACADRREPRGRLARGSLSPTPPGRRPRRSWSESARPVPARSAFGDHANAQCLRQQHLLDTRRGRRTQYRADVARILQIVEQQVESRRRGQAPASVSTTTASTPICGGERRNFGEQRSGDGHDVARRHLRDQRGDARIGESILHDHQIFRRRRCARGRRRPDARLRARICRPCADRATMRSGGRLRGGADSAAT